MPQLAHCVFKGVGGAAEALVTSLQLKTSWGCDKFFWPFVANVIFPFNILNVNDYSKYGPTIQVFIK